LNKLRRKIDLFFKKHGFFLMQSGKWIFQSTYLEGTGGNDNCRITLVDFADEFVGSMNL
jgi:hypothetical protein